jgi:hypothetical protein
MQTLLQRGKARFDTAGIARLGAIIVESENLAIGSDKLNDLDVAVFV